MRDFKNMKRQRSRNRGGGGGNSGGGKPQHNVNRAFDSNGPDSVKIRGHAQHVFEKYQQLARDASASGDRVLAENYMQHAEHYFRVLRAVQPQRLASEIIGRDAFTSGIDIDFEDENGGSETDGEASEFADESGEGREARPETRQDQRFEGGRQDYRPDAGRGEYRNNERRPEFRSDYNRQDRDNRGEPRQDNRSEGRQDVRQDPRPEPRQEPRQDSRQDRPDRPDRFEGRRDERSYNNREDRPRSYRDDRRGERSAEPAADPLAVVEPEATPLTRERQDDVSPILRSQDGGLSPAPAFLQSRAEPAPVADSGDAAPEPRRRRPRAPRRDDAATAAEET